MSPIGLIVGTAGIAYLLGCFDAGYYLVRFRTGRDIREHGSGGTGARNAGRVLGRAGFAIVFFFDCLKGAAAVWAASLMGTGRAGMGLAAIAVVIGHVFPVQLHFRGGKGASAALGALLVLAPRVAIAALLASAAFYLISRKPIASGVAAFIPMPAFAWLFGYPTSDVIAVSVVTTLLLITHRQHLPELTGLLRRTPPAIEEPSP